jgi:hypothetical protein
MWLVPIRVSQLAHELAGTFGLHGHLPRLFEDAIDIQRLPWRLHGDKPRDGFAALGDFYRATAFDLGDQFAEVGFGVGKTDMTHRDLLTIYMVI